MPDPCLSCFPETWGTGTRCERPRGHQGRHEARTRARLYWWFQSATGTEQLPVHSAECCHDDHVFFAGVDTCACGEMVLEVHMEDD